jgi:SAM-dependent MidA family methyltransferase
MKNFLKSYINNKPMKLITYAEYMDLVLYHPQYGYYMRNDEKIGRHGDFITTSNISDIFGKTIAKWFAQLVKTKGLPPTFCEVGGGNGRFAHSFLKEWKAQENPELTYIIVEKSPYHIQLQSDLFASESQIQQVESLTKLDPFKGLIFSNELFDALPVYVIKKHGCQLLEMMIGYEDEKLIEKEVVLTNNRILSYIDEHHLFIAEGQRIEIPLAMEKMVADMNRVLEEGMIVTVDYGYSNEEWSEPGRRDGSLRGYYQHHLINDVLKYPGEMDMTAHIHWDALKTIGEKYGLETTGKWRQDEFLLSIGILDGLENHQDLNPFSEVNKRNRAIRSLIMPSGISTTFQVLVQEKWSLIDQPRQA